MTWFAFLGFYSEEFTPVFRLFGEEFGKLDLGGGGSFHYLVGESVLNVLTSFLYKGLQFKTVIQNPTSTVIDSLLLDKTLNQLQSL